MKPILLLIFSALFVGSVTVPTNSYAQGFHDFTDRQPTTAELVEALSPPRMRGLPERGIEPVSSGQSCEVYQPTRGITPVAATPVANIVALTVTFAFDSAELTSENIPTVRTLGEALNSEGLKTSCIRIEGHTDSVGTAEYNLALSQRRAQSVVQYLVKHMGVSEDQLIVVGKGENDPIADNETESGRQRNRRVQVVNLGRPQLTSRER